MELGSCANHWVDVFITKSADDPTTRQYNLARRVDHVPTSLSSESGTTYTYDDEFCCSVQSIEFDPREHPAVTAFITESDSEWILPTWSHSSLYGSADAASSVYSKLKVGDLVRIGGVATNGFTDYLTVVEIRNVSYLANATSSAVTFNTSAASSQSAGTDYLEQPSSTTEPGTTTNHRLDLLTAGIAHIAIRLNASLNCTNLPTNTLNHSTNNVVHRQAVSGYADRHATLQTRQHAYEYMSNDKPAYDNEDGNSEKYYYPLYRAKNWSAGKELIARLDHGVKQVAAVKLLGYSLVNKRQVGIQHAHEMQNDDYLIMRIKELDGHVISNNQYANGAFAILRAGDTSNNLVGAAEFSAYEPAGIVCVPVHASNNTIRNITIEIIDRMGNPAHFGRLHLWLKLLVTHG